MGRHIETDFFQIIYCFIKDMPQKVAEKHPYRQNFKDFAKIFTTDD